MGHVIKVSEMSENESLDLLLQQPMLEATDQAQGLAIATILGYLAFTLNQHARNIYHYKTSGHITKEERR